MELVKNIILLLVGLSVFLIGMRMMSGSLKKAAGGRIKKLFDKFKNNRFAGIGVGAAITALIQSSDATSVMTVGFLNAGVMTLFQAIAVVMGAYIGTTVTGLLVSLSSFNSGTSFDITIFFMVFAFIGVVLSFFKKNMVRHIGDIACGLGLLFFGLFTLKAAFNSPDINEFTRSVFAVISNPLLLFVLGILVTMLIQSSSASTGIIIVMASTGAVGIENAVFFSLGATVGTVITTVIATIGGSTNTKRLAFVAISMRLLTSLLFLAILWPLNSSFGILQKASDLLPSGGLFIAVFMVTYNVLATLITAPFIEQFEKLSIKFIKDKKTDELSSYIHYIDNQMINTPYIAVTQVKKEIVNMFQLSFENYNRGFEAILNNDLSKEEEIEKTEDGIDFLNKRIADFMIELSAKSGHRISKTVGGYFHVINDIERIGDHAANFLDNARKLHDLDIHFSDVAKSELVEFNEVLNKMFKLTDKIFEENDVALLKELHELEEQTDKLKEKISTAHFKRITKNECNVELSPFYSTLVSELERIADHLTNVGYTQLNPTGDDNE